LPAAPRASGRLFPPPAGRPRAPPEARGEAVDKQARVATGWSGPENIPEAALELRWKRIFSCQDWRSEPLRAIHQAVRGFSRWMQVKAGRFRRRDT
jgi:hypothetical protein